MIIVQKSLDETDKKIIKLASEGMTSKEIGYELNLKAKAVEYRIQVMKDYYQCKSVIQLVVRVNDMIG